MAPVNAIRLDPRDEESLRRYAEMIGVDVRELVQPAKEGAYLVMEPAQGDQIKWAVMTAENFNKHFRREQ